MPKDLTRRELIQHAALVGGLSALGGVFTDRAAALTRSPNEKLDVAFIGAGGQGASDLGSISADPLVNVVALCDPDFDRAAGSFKSFPNARQYRDYRKMLEEMRGSIDAVVVSTPDHHHAPASVMAMKMRKHVYCQKPMARLVEEARVMRDVARRNRVVTQMGTQAHPSYWRLKEYVEKDVVGPITEVHVQTDRPRGWWPQGMQRPTAQDPVPATLDWDVWLGPAAERPFNRAYLPFVWRGWWDFGTGALGDMACHLMDGAFLALDLTAPTTVETQGEPLLPDAGPNSETITYTFPARGKMPAVTLHWYDGGRQIPADLLEGEKLPGDFNGSLFIGERGKLFVPHASEPVPLPRDRFQYFKAPEPYLPRPAGGHYMEWTRACREGGKCGSNFDYASNMTEAVLLGIVAFRTGKKIEWDSRRLRAKNAPEADQYIRHNYRKGWTLK